MRTVRIAFAASLVAAFGFASSASADATVDLLWGGTGTSTSVTPGASSTTLVLSVVITAGASGVESFGISVDYSSVVGGMTVLGYTNGAPAPGPFPLTLGLIADTGTSIVNINAGSLPAAFLGTGLLTGQSFLAGTITFHTTGLGAGTFSIFPLVRPATTDDVIGFGGGVITGTTTFNGATITAIPEPGTIALLGLGVGGIALIGRRRQR